MNSLPRGPLLFDTSVYIGRIRSGLYPWLSQDRDVFARTIFTAVVAAELYAGTRNPDDKLSLDTLCEMHEALGKLSFPSLDSWMLAGVLLARYARLYGDLRMADHFRDVLIALEAAKHGATLVTENSRDFFRWRKLVRASGRNLAVFDLRELSKS